LRRPRQAKYDLLVVGSGVGEAAILELIQVKASYPHMK
jgi:hypothetical protein